MSQRKVTTATDEDRRPDGLIDGGHVGLGKRLRARRLELGMSLAALARLTNLTKGHLSNIERGLASPSMASLLLLCHELQVSIGALFEPPRSALVRSSERVRIDYGGKGLDDYLLTPGSRTKLQAIHTTIAPGGSAGKEPYTLQVDEEFIFVISGTVGLDVEGVPYTLKRGDSFTFGPRTTHTFWNPSTVETAEVLFVLTPPLY